MIGEIEPARVALGNPQFARRPVVVPADEVEGVLHVPAAAEPRAPFPRVVAPGRVLRLGVSLGRRHAAPGDEPQQVLAGRPRIAPVARFVVHEGHEHGDRRAPFLFRRARIVVPVGILVEDRAEVLLALRRRGPAAGREQGEENGGEACAAPAPAAPLSRSRGVKAVDPPARHRRVRSHHDDSGLRAARAAHRRGRLVDEAGGDPPVGRGVGALGLGDHDRPAGIRGRPDRHVERNLTQEIHAQPERGLARAAVVEEFGAVAAFGADIVAHVLHDAEDRHVHLLEHVDAARHVEQRDVLRGRDDHRAGERHPLRHGELRVAGAGRQVAEQHVEFAPVDIAHHLLERLHDHRAAPDHGGVLGDQEADRHALDPVIRHGAQRALAHHLRLAAEVEHARDRGAVDVAVEQADADVLGGHGGGEVHRGRRLADAALAGRDGDDAPHPRQQLVGLARRRRGLSGGVAVAVAASLRLPAGRCAGRPLGGQHGRDREHAGQPLDRSLARLAQRLLGRALVRVDLEREADIAVPDHDSADQAVRDDAPPARRVRDIGQRRQNLFLGDRRHGSARHPPPGPRRPRRGAPRVFRPARRCVRRAHDL